MQPQKIMFAMLFLFIGFICRQCMSSDTPSILTSPSARSADTLDQLPTPLTPTRPQDTYDARSSFVSAEAAHAAALAFAAGQNEKNLMTQSPLTPPFPPRTSSGRYETAEPPRTASADTLDDQPNSPLTPTIPRISSDNYETAEGEHCRPSFVSAQAAHCAALAIAAGQNEKISMAQPGSAEESKGDSVDHPIGQNALPQRYGYEIQSPTPAGSPLISNINDGEQEIEHDSVADGPPGNVGATVPSNKSVTQVEFQKNYERQNDLVDDDEKKNPAKKQHEDQDFEEIIAYLVVIGCFVLVVITYLGLASHAIYESIYHNDAASEVDIFSDEFIENQKRIFAIEEEIERKNKNAKISFATMQQIQYENRENPLTLTELVQAMHKILREAEALELLDSVERNKLKKTA